MVAVPPLIWYNLFKIKIFYIQRGKIMMKLNYAAEYRAAAREAALPAGPRRVPARAAGREQRARAGGEHPKASRVARRRAARHADALLQKVGAPRESRAVR